MGRRAEVPRLCPSPNLKVQEITAFGGAQEERKASGVLPAFQEPEGN